MKNEDYIGKFCTFSNSDGEGRQGVAVSKSEFMLFDGHIEKGEFRFVVKKPFYLSEHQKKVLEISP